MNAWYQIWVQVPLLGRQWGGWLYTDQIRAFALAAGLKTCPGGAVSIYDQAGNELVPGALSFPIPGF